MQFVHDSRIQVHQMLVPSPRCILNCQALSIHLPPLSESCDRSSLNKHLSLSMSTSSKYSRPSLPQRSSYLRRYSISPESGGSSTSKPSTLQSQIVQSPPHYTQRELTTPSGTVVEDRGSFSDANLLKSSSSGERSLNNLDSPEDRHFAAGSPGLSRKVKAHVPSACVNCKRKHLACETKRPCGRCVQTGKEVSCSRKLFDYGLQSIDNLRRCRA